MSHKMILCLAFLSALVSTVISGYSISPYKGKANQFTYGKGLLYDKYLVRAIFSAPPRKTYFAAAYQKTFKIPLRFHKITQVICLDLNTKRPFGRCTIVKGGPGSTFVTLRFWAKVGKPINFLVQVMGI